MLHLDPLYAFVLLRHPEKGMRVFNLMEGSKWTRRLKRPSTKFLLGGRETTYYVCQVCGYVSDGVLPKVCPVCSAPQEQFVEFK